MTEALTEFSHKGLKSIALPAVGTGMLCYPRSKMAEVLVSATVMFLTENPGSTLKEISFVSYFDDMIMQVG